MTLKKGIFLLSLLCGFVYSQQNSVSKIKETANEARKALLKISQPQKTPAVFSHQIFDQLLKKYVKNGKVNYKKWKQDATFAVYLERISAQDPDSLASREEKLVFWINAYNALTIRSVLDADPVKSVREIPGFFDSILHPAGGKAVTLNQIENEMIRRPFGENRIHFALVYASRSSPDLETETWKAQKLNDQLDRAAGKFINDVSRNRFFPKENRAEISPVFTWYREDFESGNTTVLTFIARYLENPGEMMEINFNQWKVKFLDFDWKLNDQE